MWRKVARFYWRRVVYFPWPKLVYFILPFTTIEFNLRIVDAETWEEIVTTDAMTLNFE